MSPAETFGSDFASADPAQVVITVPHRTGRQVVEVLHLHLREGARVETGTPVLTLLVGGRRQMVRAPRRGKATPLVAIGDRLVFGDGLYRLQFLEND